MWYSPPLHRRTHPRPIKTFFFINVERTSSSGSPSSVGGNDRASETGSNPHGEAGVLKRPSVRSGDSDVPRPHNQAIVKQEQAWVCYSEQGIYATKLCKTE